MRLDSADKKILVMLQGDGRKTIQSLSEAVGLSPSPCLRRVRLLEDAQVIKGYVAVVAQDAVGLPVSVFISIKLHSQHDEDLDVFGSAIRQWREVLECYLMTGHRDFLMRVVCADLASYERFLREKLTRLGNVASIESSFALRQVKHTNVLPIAP